MNHSSWTAGIIQTRSNLERVRLRAEYEQQQLDRTRARLAEIEGEKAELLKAVALIDSTISVVSANGIQAMESTVTQGLQLVFDDPTLSFVVVKTEGKRGNNYSLECRQGDVQGPILDTFGGGVANVVSFLLRVIFVKRFKLAKFLVIDESFNNVSAQVLPMVSQLLQSLAKDSGYTIFAVTHQPILASAADHVYQVTASEAGPRIRALSPEEATQI